MARYAELGEGWESRSEYWREASTSQITLRSRRQRRKEPLILCGHGVSLRIDGGALLIREGRTHHPQTPKTWRFFKGDLATPPRIILLGGSGVVTLDVLDWLAAQNLPLIRLHIDGSSASIFGGFGYAADRAKVAWQEATRADVAARLAFSSDLIRHKLVASAETLTDCFAPSRLRDAAIAKIRRGAEMLEAGPPKDLTALRLIEATSASAYFGAWKELVIRWIGAGRKPIPDDWRVFTSRTSLSNNGKLLNINASHPVNAMLNLSYAALEANLKIKALADGYDPTIGIMHHGRREKSAYVFDIMEPERPKVDRLILNFLADNPLASADFVIRTDGVVRLNPRLAAHVCGLVANV